MTRVLVISDESKELSWLWEAPSLQNCEIETVGEEADVLHLLRRRDFDIVVTRLTAPRRSDFAHLSEMLRFGIMLTKQLVDEVIYNEIGNEVLLIKHTC